jgi:hypothetical protein
MAMTTSSSISVNALVPLRLSEKRRTFMAYDFSNPKNGCVGGGRMIFNQGQYCSPL